eukprot:3919869-Heterocapsa_arctica.AAC.1
MSIVLMLAKGRSSSTSLNRICRQWGAYCFASGVVPTVRWIPSERNPADAASRNRAFVAWNS